MLKVIIDGRVVKAGGIIVWEQDGEKLYLLIYRARHKDYSFPKGHLEPGETPEECAIREVREETGLTAKIIEEMDPELYHNPKSNEETILHMFLMSVAEDTLKIENDGDKLVWVKRENMAELLHPNLYNYFENIAT